MLLHPSTKGQYDPGSPMMNSEQKALMQPVWAIFGVWDGGQNSHTGHPSPGGRLYLLPIGLPASGSLYLALPHFKHRLALPAATISFCLPAGQSTHSVSFVLASSSLYLPWRQAMHVEFEPAAIVEL